MIGACVPAAGSYQDSHTLMHYLPRPRGLWIYVRVQVMWGKSVESAILCTCLSCSRCEVACFFHWGGNYLLLTDRRDIGSENGVVDVLKIDF